MQDKYQIILIHDGLAGKAAKIEQAIIERLKNLDIREDQYDILTNPALNKLHAEDSIYLGLYLVDPSTKTHKHCTRLARWLIKHYHVILPILYSGDYQQQTPSELHLINGFRWRDYPNPMDLLVNITLENLGLTEENRRVFISYKRSDGSGLADQLYDALSRKGFKVFKDNYTIRPGRNIQETIFETLEEMAYVVLIDSPEAKHSVWVEKEIEFVMANELGLTVLKPTQTASGLSDKLSLPAQLVLNLSKDQLKDRSASPVITLNEKALNNIVDTILSNHAERLLQRKMNMVNSILGKARASGKIALQQYNWQIRIKDSTNKKDEMLIAIAPRTPEPEDFFYLDTSEPKRQINKCLAHQTTIISQKRTDLNRWTLAGKKNIEMQDIASLIAEL